LNLIRLSSVANFWNKESFLKRLANLFSKRQRKNFLLLVFFQTVIGFLDLVGIGLIGIVGTLAVSGVQSGQPTGSVVKLLGTLGLSNLTVQQQVSIMALAAVVVFTTKTVFSIFFTKKILNFLGNRSRILSTETLSKILKLPYNQIREFSNQRIVFSINDGINTLFVGIISSVSNLIADLFLLVIVFIMLLLVNPLLAFLTLLLFILILILLNRILNQKARKLGRINSETNVSSREILSDMLDNYKEILVRNRHPYFLKKFDSLRESVAESTAELNFMPYVGKYVIESSLLIVGLILSGVQFLLTDASQAFGVLAVFLAAGSRIAPAILRVQQGSLFIRGNIGLAASSLELIEHISKQDANPPQKNHSFSSKAAENLDQFITLKDINLNDSKGSIILQDISCSIRFGEKVTILGKSGSGKSSLIDLILGVNVPTSGTILLSGQRPRQFLQEANGMIGYVPQETHLFDNSIYENVLIGDESTEMNLEKVRLALERAALDEFIENGLHRRVGHAGSSLSGGQRQRIGLARALYTNPQILVLDEATNSLDKKTENQILQLVEDLFKGKTLITVSHNTNRLLPDERVLYLSNGKLVHDGAFKNLNPEYLVDK
jgi:ATP-binding cassette, subfamily B, bacterial PglK